MKIKLEKDQLVLYLEGRISSLNAAETEQEIREILRENPNRPVLFDAENLKYISSAGLRILLSIRKKLNERLTVRGVSPEVYEILEASGFTNLLDVRKRMRRISVDGCEVIGNGAIGTVYRIDEDTVVKVYKPDDSLPMIENEQKKARQAFLKGIPTAIPLDIVRVGDKYGSVFELLKAENCAEVLARHPERLDDICEMYARLIRQVHAVEDTEGALEDTRKIFAGYLEDIRPLLPPALYERIHALLQAMPAQRNIVHGDLQLKNIMLVDGEMILIDMETLSAGNPVFDFAGLFMAYVAFDEDEPGNSKKFLGLEYEIVDQLYHRTLRAALEEPDEELYAKKLDRIALLGYVRFLYVLHRFQLGADDLRQLRIRHAIEHLEDLSSRVTELAV